jgi:hypothetical protein
MTKAYLIIPFFLLTSCANINSLFGIYHERIEQKNSIKNIENNGLKTLQFFSKTKLDTGNQEYNLIFIFSYGCSFNDKFIAKLDSISLNKKNSRFLYNCDNLTTKKRTDKLINKLNPNVAKFLIYTKKGIKKSLHKIGENYGYNSTLENYPNNLYIIDKKGKILYACFSPTRKHLDSINKILN